MRPEDREHLGAALAVLRSILGWDQAEVARAGGIPPSSVSDYERGKVIPSARTLAKILSGMNLPPGALETALGCVRAVRTLGKRGPQPAAEPAAGLGSAAAGFDRALTTLVRASRRLGQEGGAGEAEGVSAAQRPAALLNSRNRPLAVNEPPAPARRPPAGVDRPSEAVEGAPEAVDRPPEGVGRPPAAVGRPPEGVEGAPKGVDRPPEGAGRPPEAVDRPPAGVDRLPAGVEGAPAGVDRPPEEVKRQREP